MEKFFTILSWIGIALSCLSIVHGYFVFSKMNLFQQKLSEVHKWPFIVLLVSTAWLLSRC